MNDIEKVQLRVILDNGPSYAEGVAIYTKYGRNKNLIRFFQKQNPATEEKLEYELRKLADWPKGSKPVKVAPVVKPPIADGSAPLTMTQTEKAAPAEAAATKPEDDTLKPGADAPEVMKAVWGAYKHALKERDRKKGALAELPEEPEHDTRRNELAGEILGLSDSAAEAREALVLYKEKGEVPVIVPPAPAPTIVLPETLPKGFDLTDLGKVQKRITTVTANMSRDRAKGKDVLRWELEKEFLERVLDGTIQP